LKTISKHKTASPNIFYFLIGILFVFVAERSPLHLRTKDKQSAQ